MPHTACYLAVLLQRFVTVTYGAGVATLNLNFNVLNTVTQSTYLRVAGHLTQQLKQGDHARYRTGFVTNVIGNIIALHGHSFSDIPHFTRPKAWFRET